jgi:putative component of toxin-antitoxin plasmid stabilization module
LPAQQPGCREKLLANIAFDPDAPKATRPSLECQTAQDSASLDRMYPSGYNKFMYTVRLTEEFVAWLDGLKDKRAKVRIAARLRQVEAGNLGDWQPIEGDVAELRVDSGDKASQKRDIRRTLKLANELGDDL